MADFTKVEDAEKESQYGYVFGVSGPGKSPSSYNKVVFALGIKVVNSKHADEACSKLEAFQLNHVTFLVRIIRASYKTGCVVHGQMLWY